MIKSVKTVLATGLKCRNNDSGAKCLAAKANLFHFAQCANSSVLKQKFKLFHFFSQELRYKCAELKEMGSEVCLKINIF